MGISNVEMSLLDMVKMNIEKSLGEQIRAIVSGEADKSAEEVRKRVNGLVAATALNVAKWYEVEYDRGRIVIEIRGVPKVEKPLANKESAPTKDGAE